MSFYNPYHFVSVKKDKRISDFSVEKFESKDFSTHKYIQQDRFLSEAKSGRIICRVTTKSPIVVGDKHDDSFEPTKVGQYCSDGKPAIPATSLKGMISSIVEAATNSSLRVLNDDRFFSYRKQMTQGISAIGMIVIEDRKIKLRPLTLPTIVGQKGSKVTTKYHNVFEKPNLKVYVDQNPTYESYRDDDQVFYYLKLQNRDWEDGEHIKFDESQHWKEGARDVDFLIAQKRLGNQILTQAQYNNLTDQNEKEMYVRGILRVLGCDERKKEMPNTRKHEVFVPYPEDALGWQLLEIPKHVVTKFEELSDQMTETTEKKILNEIKKIRQSQESEEIIKKKIESIKRNLLPFEPINTVRNENPKNENDFTFRLKEGDLVYFSLNDKLEVNEISLSSIWRDRKEIQKNGISRGINSHDFFKLVDSELIPFCSERKQITFAEQMFGFVEQVTDVKKRAGLALAGRINFSDAKVIERADNSYFQNGWKTLKILASPKLPSPVLYFKKGNGKAGYYSKDAISPSPTGSQPQGRKFYLHHKRTDRWETEEVTENISQKVQVQPVKKGISFLFHIDFANLSPLELSALLYGLCPTETFEHKIGLGKPLGLGSVKIDIEGLFLTNRVYRYSVDGLFAQRYEKFWRNDKNSSDWSNLYKREKSATKKESVISIENFVNKFRDQVNETQNGDLLQAIESLGTSKLDSVHYPKVLDKSDEDENFLWFVANDSKPNTRGVRKVRVDNRDYNNTSNKFFSLKPIVNGKIEPLEDIPLEEIHNR